MRAILTTFPFTLLGCVDLPSGWEDALPIEDFDQSACTDGDPYGESDERVEASAEANSLAVDYLEAHFRCGQAVEGFYKTDGDAVDVLVQPVDMDPGLVAKCDCLYDVSLSLPLTAPATLTVYRRWDNLNDPNDPVEVGAVELASE